MQINDHNIDQMNKLSAKENRGLYITYSTMLLGTFATVFFPRLFSTLGFPDAINFLHFIVIPLVSLLIVIRSRAINHRQPSITKQLLIGQLVLGWTMAASALINQAGFINIIMSYLLLVEPIMFLTMMVSTSFNKHSLAKFRKWIVGFSWFHIFLALSQRILLDAGILKKQGMTLDDNVQGVFYISGGGHVVSGAVAISFGVYFYASSKEQPLLIRLSGIFLSLLVVLWSDAKQVVFVVFMAWITLAIIDKRLKSKLFNIILLSIVLCSFGWALLNLDAFRYFTTWIRPDIYGVGEESFLEGEAFKLKFSSIVIIYSYLESPLNWLFGLGPGHTVGRLGGWMLDKYGEMLIPLGATIHPVSGEVWNAIDSSWLGKKSSMFAPLFGWAGIWGDFGILGLMAYLFLGQVIWSHLCKDNISRFLLLTVPVHGFIFSVMEEPGFMIYIACLIALRWHENQICEQEMKISPKRMERE